MVKELVLKVRVAEVQPSHGWGGGGAERAPLLGGLLDHRVAMVEEVDAHRLRVWVWPLPQRAEYVLLTARPCQDTQIIALERPSEARLSPRRTRGCAPATPGSTTKQTPAPWPSSPRPTMQEHAA